VIPAHQLEEFVIEALKARNGSAHLKQVARHVWDSHQALIMNSGDSQYTWQYDIRWAAQRLRDNGTLKSDKATPRGIWALAE
jgi:hypothetical protein